MIFQQTLTTMKTIQRNISTEVTQLLDGLNLPLRKEIEELRLLILSVNPALSENIKWNAPNYSLNGEDRITMRIHPAKQIQVIFHRGAKKLLQPAQRLIKHDSPILMWKQNDRAIVSFTNMNEIRADASELKEIVRKWIAASI
jgi:hypothetical protein